MLREALTIVRKHKASIVIAKLDRLSRDVALISNLTAQRTPFIITELGTDVDPIMLHIYAAFAEGTGADRTADARGVSAEEGVLLGNRTNLALA